ncbi:VOC family protein [Novosphingopyxis iocasae]|uniref:VOC family protein n=1 Tax=Novosphingopyxis iocasae TaxID=2762729 RepID=UPI0016513990|nr:VOC family protein [Novosphingopyxis iocasae]
MTDAFIEHINITVTDPDEAAEKLRQIFGWAERWRGPALNGGRTIHLGSSDHYLALYSPKDAPAVRFPKGAPLQHIGVVVDDLDAAESRVSAAGYRPFNHGDYEPGRRFYFLGPDDIEFEVVSYA